MKILYALLAAAILALGVLHMATTFRLSSSPVAKVWFFGAGMAVALGGVMNFLNRQIAPPRQLRPSVLHSQNL